MLTAHILTMWIVTLLLTCLWTGQPSPPLRKEEETLQEKPLLLMLCKNKGLSTSSCLSLSSVLTQSSPGSF